MNPTSLDQKRKNDQGWLTVGPDFYEMAKRYLSRARYENDRAKYYGDSPKGRQHSADAQFYFRQGQRFQELWNENSRLRDYGRTR